MHFLSNTCGFGGSSIVRDLYIKTSSLKQYLLLQIENNLSENFGKSEDSFIRQFVAAQLGDDGKELDREELIFAVRELFVAGTDTVSNTLLWAVVLLANHPNVQTRLQHEVDSVVGADRLPALTDESSMPYTQAVILETMRRHTMVPRSLFRATLCDTRIAGDLFIPAKTMVSNAYIDQLMK